MIRLLPAVLLALLLGACAALAPPSPAVGPAADIEPDRPTGPQPARGPGPTPSATPAKDVSPADKLADALDGDADADADAVADTVADADPVADVAPRPPAATSPAPPRREAIPGLCEELGDLLGSVSIDTCLGSDLVHDDARSHDGRPLAWVEFPARTLDAPRILVIGGIHGDEYASISMVFRWIERLQVEHDGARAWRLVPAANPDGLLGLTPARRTNARGVDLNRNFATPDWEHEAHRWWEERTRRDPRRRPGAAPASEAETRWLQAFIGAWRPDVIVAIHAPHDLLDFDASSGAVLEAPQRLGFLELRPLGTYPGSLGRYGSRRLGVPVLTLELPWAGIMPSPEDQHALWRDLSSWLGTHLPGAGIGAQLSGP